MYLGLCNSVQSDRNVVVLYSRYVVSSSFGTSWTVALLGSTVHGISQVRILDWVAIPSPRDLSDSEDPADSLPLSHQESLYKNVAN